MSSLEDDTAPKVADGAMEGQRPALVDDPETAYTIAAETIVARMDAPLASAPMAGGYGSVLGPSALPLSDAVSVQPAAGGEQAHPFEVEERERYRRAALLGRGGMGQVSAVRDQRLHREVALKETGARGGAVLEQRLAQEAWITAQLDHPGIVPIYDAGRGPDGRLFFTMRLIHGRSLAQVLEDGDLDQSVLLRHFLAVCQALAYAHATGMLHRDLKPANIMVGAFGETQVMDWGLACQIVDSEGDRGGARPTHLVPEALAATTEFGTRVGTPAYMSPEQARAQTIGPPSDVWSLGAVLFEILSGRALFENKSSAEIYEALEHGRVPDLAPLGPNVSGELVAIAERALSYEASARYRDAQELADDVAAYLDGRRVAAHSYSTWEMIGRFGRAFRLPLLVGVAALITAAVVFGVSYTQTLEEREQAQSARAQTEVARERASTAESETVEAKLRATRTRDQQLLIRGWEATRRGRRAEAEVLAAHAGALEPSVWANGILARFEAASRPLHRSTHLGVACEGKLSSALSPSGDWTSCDLGHEVAIYHTRDGSKLWERPLRATHFMFVSDDYLAAANRFGGGALRILDRSTGAVVTRFADANLNGAVAAASTLLFEQRGQLTVWSSDSHHRARVKGPSRGLRAISGDATKGLVIAAGWAHVLNLADGTEHKLKLDWSTWLPGDAERSAEVTAAALINDGDWMALGGADGVVRVITTDDGMVLWKRRVARRAVTHIAWSPDEMWLAVTIKGGNLHVLDAAGRGELGFPRSPVSRVAWRRRGESLELLTTGEGTRVYDMPARFSASAIETSVPLSQMRLSRDGSSVVVTDGASTIGLYTSEGTAVRVQLLASDGARAVAGFWGATRRRVAFSDGAENRMRIMEPDGSVSTGAGPGFVRYILSAGRSGVVGVDLIGRVTLTVDAGEPASIALPKNRMVAEATGSGDGNRFAIRQALGAVFVTEIQAGRLTPARAIVEDRSVRGIALDHSGQLLATGTGTTVALRAVDTGAVVRVFDGAPDAVTSVALSQGGEWVAAGTRSGDVAVWRRTGRLALIGSSHLERVSSLAFGPEGRWVMSASEDGTLVRWGLNHLNTSPAALVADREQSWGVTLEDIFRARVR